MCEGWGVCREIEERDRRGQKRTSDRGVRRAEREGAEATSVTLWSWR